MHKGEKYVSEIRELQIEDIENGFLKTLDSLKPGTSKIDTKNATIRFNELMNTNFKIFVALQGNQVICTIALTIEPKFINNLGIVAHIEDVATREDLMGKGIGQVLLSHVLDYADKRKCYKTILNCEKKAQHFYEIGGMIVAKNDKSEKEFEMRYDYPHNKK